MGDDLSAAIVGSGPNGLASAVTLARAGLDVTVFEAADTVGGGAQTVDLADAGVVHDRYSAIHPLAMVSEFFREFELSARVQFSIPEASYAHPMDGSSPAVVAFLDLERTAQQLGRDGLAYSRMYQPLIRDIPGLYQSVFGGASGLSVLAHPRVAAALARRVVEQGSGLWDRRFDGEAAPALLTGVMGHSSADLPSLSSAGVGLMLGALGHSTGWPVPRGGSGAISDALVADLIAHGGRVVLGRRIENIAELAGYRLTFFDTSARGLVRIAGAQLPPRYRRSLERFRYGSGISLLHLVLDGPIPWADTDVALAPTVHLGGTRAEIARAQFQANRGNHPESPYVLLTQPTAWDLNRNPAGIHAVSAYARVPAGSNLDVSAAMIAQIERFAPGVRDLIRTAHFTPAAELAGENPNFVGGDLGSGALTLRQVLARPRLGRWPWRTPLPGVYLASASTAPGPGVHGLAGWYAAKLALRQEFELPAPRLGLD